MYKLVTMNIISKALGYLSKARISTAPTEQITTKLGRWKIDYSHQVIQRKVDQANEDHCGCCVNEFDDNDNVAEKKDKYFIYYL
jgi:hypothetical protein